MMRLAWPVVAAELGWMFMGVVDTVMVGRLSPEAIGAVGMSSTIFLALGIFGMGLLLGLDTLVAQAFGAGSLEACHRWLVQGAWLAILATPPIVLATYAMAATMPVWGMHPAVLALAQPYLAVVAWSALPLLLYAAFRRYLQALNLVRPVMFAVVSANIINMGANWLLIFGNWGFPALGAVGAAWATVLSRTYIALVLGGVVLVRGWRTGLLAAPRRMHTEDLGRLLALGGPAAMQLVAEVGVFAVVTVLAARLDPIALASHQIALNVASVSFMVPLGVASAGAVRVGHAVGRRDAAGASRSGWTAIALGVGFMAVAAFTFLTTPRPLVSLFSLDPAVIATGVSLLLIAAAFQLFDGLQAVTTGVLRGLGDTRTPMLSNLAGHWLLGLPISYLLCFQAGWGVVGLWIGLSLGLVTVALVLLAAWSTRIATLRRVGVRAEAGFRRFP
jgi:multidrug resistance protein, MATE family